MNRAPSQPLVYFFSLGKELNPLKAFVSFKGLRKGRHSLKNHKGKQKDFRAERTSINVEAKLTSTLKELTEILSLMGFVKALEIKLVELQQRNRKQKNGANTLIE